jgi:hypothetical protein
MPWHTDEQLYSSPQWELIYVVENTSDSKTQWLDEEGDTNEEWTPPNSLLAVLVRGIHEGRVVAAFRARTLSKQTLRELRLFLLFLPCSQLRTSMQRAAAFDAAACWCPSGMQPIKPSPQCCAYWLDLLDHRDAVLPAVCAMQAEGWLHRVTPVTKGSRTIIKLAYTTTHAKVPAFDANLSRVAFQ